MNKCVNKVIHLPCMRTIYIPSYILNRKSVTAKKILKNILDIYREISRNFLT
jgi:hypothetical protein